MADSIDIGDLLTIDVASELRKLSQAQLQGPWQIPAELVRRSIRAGAKSVRVGLGRHQVEVVDDGRGIESELLQWTGILLDERRSNEDRHAALTTLEQAGELVLLALAGLEPRGLEISTCCAGQRHVLEFVPGRTAWVRSEAYAGADETTVTLRSAKLERRQAVNWLLSVSRFAPIPIELDGKPVDTGFSEVMAHGVLQRPLQGRLALPTTGDTAHAWLLEHGLVTGHVAVPDAPCFEAAVELGHLGAELNAATLRDAIRPDVPALVDQALGLLITVGSQCPRLPETTRTRVARLVLQAARKRQRFRDLATVKVFRGFGPTGTTFFDLVGLKQAIEHEPGGNSALRALYPGQKPERFAIGERPVLIAGETERSLLSEVLGVRFRAPPTRASSTSLAAGWRRLVHHTKRGLSRVIDKIRHPVTLRVDDRLLDETERTFLQAMRSHVASGRHRPMDAIEMCAGSGPVRRVRGPPRQLLLPRHNPAVVAAVRALQHDIRWIYPVYLALLEGRDLPPKPLRRAWLEPSD